jgi:predicted nucleic acid-binding protein
MKKAVYIESTIPSYLTAKPSRDLRAAAWQEITAQWWQESRPNYELFTSEIVHLEASRGDADAAARRVACLEGIARLKVDGEARRLAERIVADGGMPTSAEVDALHVAVAAVHGLDYLLTWNCRHIDNAALRPKLRSICLAAGYRCPEICTPLELLSEGEDHVS